MSICSQTNKNNLISIDLNNFSSIFKVEPQEFIDNSKLNSPLLTFEFEEEIANNSDPLVNKYSIYYEFINLIFHKVTLAQNNILITDDDFLLHVEKVIDTHLANYYEDPKNIYIKLLILLAGVNILNNKNSHLFSVNEKENFIKLQVLILNKLTNLILVKLNQTKVGV